MKATEAETKTKWSIDQSHSEIGFRVRHLMIAHVKGAFKEYEASISIENRDFTTAEIDVTINASSIATGDEKRDEHLKSEDFFDVGKFKQISFMSSTIGKPDADGKSELWGELTMKGITRNIMLEVVFGGITKDPWGNEKAGFALSGKINRSEWGLMWNSVIETGGVLVGDEITISCEVELINTGLENPAMELKPTPYM